MKLIEGLIYKMWEASSISQNGHFIWKKKETKIFTTSY